jgi:hypothetical protein
MDRRRFLASLLAAAPALALADPERLIWTPGQKTIILPPAGGWEGKRAYDLLKINAYELARQIDHDVMSQLMAGAEYDPASEIYRVHPAQRRFFEDLASPIRLVSTPFRGSPSVVSSPLYRGILKNSR